MIGCPSTSELDGFLAREDDLPGDAEIAQHLDSCRNCRQYVNSRVTLLIDPKAEPDAEIGTVIEPLLRYAPGRLSAQVTGEILDRLRFIPRACYEPLPENAAADAPPPKNIDGYEIVRELGRGGMGRVYLVQRNGQPEQCALKLLSADVASHPAAVRLARKEILALKSLQHDNIVRAIDEGEFNGRPFLVTEYLDGQNLESYIHTHGPMSVQQACRSAVAAAQGLRHAHERGIVHRDIKPSNLFLIKSGELKLLDFGVAHYDLSPETSSQRTPSGLMMGTAHYMPPEQMESARKADERSDIYALACVLVFLLTGKPVFEAAKYYEILVAHRFTPAPGLREKLPSVPELLNTFVLRSLEKVPEKRPQSMQEVIDALTPFTVDELAAAPVMQSSDPASVPNSTQPESPKPVVEPMTTVEIVLGIVLFCAVAIFTLWLLVQGL